MANVPLVRSFDAGILLARLLPQLYTQGYLTLPWLAVDAAVTAGYHAYISRDVVHLIQEILQILAFFIG